MPVWSGVPVPIGRMLGQVDQDDPTNLPVGCASVCRNTDFTREATGSALCANTRFGNCMIMAGSQSPGTGLFDFQYEPQTAADPFFQMVLRFTQAGVLEREQPTGSGRLIPTPAGMFAPPAESHAILCQTNNLVFIAYSNLTAPTAGPSCFNPKTLTHDPMGMKPYGFRWAPATYVYAGEVVTPSQAATGLQGNGHTYQAQNSGWTSAAAGGEPVWPLTEGGQVIEGGVGAGQQPVTWKELTMVLANRLPAPPAPALALVNGGGTFPANQTVFVLLTLTNSDGETVGGTVASITTTQANQGVKVTMPAAPAVGGALPGWMAQLAAPYAITGVNVYEADAAAGSNAPAQSAYARAASGQALGGNYTITATAGGARVPTENSARITPGQLPTPDVAAVAMRTPAGGAFPAGRDVYIRISYSNANGETPLGPASSVLNTLANDGVQVQLTAPADLPELTTINVYEADVPTGAVAPPAAAFALSATQVGLPGNVLVSETATGRAPVTANGTGPGGNIVADTATGGINSTQGYRYAAPGWINRNQTFSGFTQAAVSKYDVDQDGWELAVFNVPLGPANVIGRTVNLTVADGTQAGPFFWIGNVNLTVPSQNQVYPNSYPSDGYTTTPTVFLDNKTTSGTFNFTDEYLQAANDATDRLRVVGPPQGMRAEFLKSAQRMAVFGVPGYSGPWISLGEDYESFYSDTGNLPIPGCVGFRCWGSAYFRNQLWYMGERSCGVIEPSTADPSSWAVTERWDEIGPCGPRAWGVAQGQFIFFVHRSGAYKYDGTGAPDLMSKEIPRMWSAINWLAAETICVTVDTDLHVVKIQVPVYGSLVPNMEFCIGYMEGWQNPIHFMTFTQKEVTLEAARRWSFNDVSSFVCKRIYRTVANPPELPLAPDGTAQMDSAFFVTQLAYTSALADGLVNARTPGRYDDNGAGIDWRYVTVSAQAMQKPSKPEGVVISALGEGPINVSWIAGRGRWDDGGPRRILKCIPVQLTAEQMSDFTRKPERSMDEYWSVMLDNGKQPGVWASVKKMQAYVIPVKQARGYTDAQAR